MPRPLQKNDAQAYDTLQKLCFRLGISLAAGKNWVRLGKLVPDRVDGQQVLFLRSKLPALERRLEKLGALQSRRNKSRAAGNRVYTGYLQDARNESVLQALLDILPTPLSNAQLRALLANYALQLFAEAFGIAANEANLLEPFQQGTFSLGEYDSLIQGLLGNRRVDLARLPLSTQLFPVSGEDVLGFAYQSLQCQTHRKAGGGYYTPYPVVHSLTDAMAQSPAELTDVFDPACGTGNFLLELARRGAPLSALYGQDRDPIAICLTRINLALWYLPATLDSLLTQITCDDTLLHPPSRRFSLLIGNPPWGSAFSEAQYRKLALRYTCAGKKHAESGDLFVECALNLLKEQGTLAFVLPEALLHVRTHRPVRELLLNQVSFHSLTYLGEAFFGVHCPSIALVLKKENAGQTAGCRVWTPENAFTVHVNRKLTSDSFSLRCSDAEEACLSDMEAVPHQLLYGQAVFALGIVTGSNRTSLADHPEEGLEPILRGSDLDKFCSCPPSVYLQFCPENFQQTAPLAVYRTAPKLLYRFICRSLVFAYDDRGTLSLNSANLLIPQIPGMDLRYVLAVMNSRAAQFYWTRRFHSVKVLRSHLEQMPIPEASVEQQDAVIALVDRLLLGESASALYEALDGLVMEIYRLNSAQQEQIRGACPAAFLPKPKIETKENAT